MTDRIESLSCACTVRQRASSLPSISIASRQRVEADARAEQWADLPMVSDGFETARAAIVARVEQLLTTLSADIAKNS